MIAPTETYSAGKFTWEMIREMEANTPIELCEDPPKRWQWRADYLSAFLKNPKTVCECDNVALDKNVMDHTFPNPSPVDEDNKKLSVPQLVSTSKIQKRANITAIILLIQAIALMTITGKTGWESIAQLQYLAIFAIGIAVGIRMGRSPNY